MTTQNQSAALSADQEIYKQLGALEERTRTLQKGQEGLGTRMGELEKKIDDKLERLETKVDRLLDEGNKVKGAYKTVAVGAAVITFAIGVVSFILSMLPIHASH